MNQVEECEYQIQYNQIFDDCEGALKFAENNDEIEEILSLCNRQLNELDNQQK